MNLRVTGCRACAERTSGDCGGHGPLSIVYPYQTPDNGGGSAPAFLPAPRPVEPRVVSKGDTLTMTEVVALGPDEDGYYWLVNERVGIRVMVRHGLRFIYAPGVIPKDGVILTERVSRDATPGGATDDREG